MNDGINKLTYF